MNNRTNDEFLTSLWEHYDNHARSLPWRISDKNGRFNPYVILVSEVMLQQTQVHRVVPKFQEFIYLFPTLQDLARADFALVLKTWNGLGYNRRAKYLHDAVKKLSSREAPWTVELLTACQGIGYNTAAAICVYSYNQPLLFIETNVRTVYIHHFFPGKKLVDDEEIRVKLAETIDVTRPREFYWAVMDYGSHLKKQGIKAAQRSRQYKKQTPFRGSDREIRGKIIKTLSAEGALPTDKLVDIFADKRLHPILDQLQAEGLITINKNIAQIT